jgi:hypothetical protein
MKLDKNQKIMLGWVIMVVGLAILSISQFRIIQVQKHTIDSYRDVTDTNCCSALEISITKERLCENDISFWQEIAKECDDNK